MGPTACGIMAGLIDWIGGPSSDRDRSLYFRDRQPGHGLLKPVPQRDCLISDGISSASGSPIQIRTSRVISTGSVWFSSQEMASRRAWLSDASGDSTVIEPSQKI